MSKPLLKRGSVLAQRTVTHKAKDGSVSDLLPTQTTTGMVGKLKIANGAAGMGLRLTIPGPKGTYASATVEVWCELPTDGSLEGTRVAHEQASDYLQQRLAEESNEIHKFFSSL